MQNPPGKPNKEQSPIITGKNCTEHPIKPYEYFDEENKKLYCVKCVEALNSTEHERVNQKISYIEEYLKEKEENEDYYEARIDSARDNIKLRIDYAEKLFEQLNKYEKNFYNKLEEERNKSIEQIEDEGLSRMTFLSSTFMEIQRIGKEINTKIVFNKEQKTDIDVSTFLYMNQIYLSFMQKELLPNLDTLSSKNFDSFLSPIKNDTESIECEPVELEEYK